jgi:hypothetical protein
MAEQSSNTWNEGDGPESTAAGSSPQPMGELRQKVADVADAQKNRAADGLGGIAEVARQTGEDLRSQNEALASWVNAASDQLRHMADRLRDRPAAELADEIARFARERPALFLGGAFLLGLGVARLLKSSPHRAWDGGYGAGRYQPVGYPESTMRASGEGRPGGTWAPSSGAY